jgi:hypothetical protein
MGFFVSKCNHIIIVISVEKKHYLFSGKVNFEKEKYNQIQRMLKSYPRIKLEKRI